MAALPAPALALARGKAPHFCTLGIFRVSHQIPAAPARPWFGPSQTPQDQLIQRPENPKFRNFGRKGSGAKRAVSAAGGLVGTGGKCPGGVFLVCMNGRVSEAGFPKRGSKTPLFTPYERPSHTGLHSPGGSQHCNPYKLVLCSDRPRTGRNAPVSVAERLVGTGGKYPGSGFPVYSNGRASAAGLRKRGPKTPLFTPGVSPPLRGLQQI